MSLMSLAEQRPGKARRQRLRAQRRLRPPRLPRRRQQPRPASASVCGAVQRAMLAGAGRIYEAGFLHNMCGPHLGSARLEEPVEAEAPGLPDLRLELVPGAVAQLVHHAHQEAVLLLRVRLALVGAIRQLQLLRDQGLRVRGVASDKIAPPPPCTPCPCWRHTPASAPARAGCGARVTTLTIACFCGLS